MSNYRGGGYRDRERPGPYRDSYSDRDRDRDWRDRDRDRDNRRDPRYDDARRRYDSHEGPERPLGDSYDRYDDRRRPPRDYDRPAPRRFERDYDRPPRYGPPAAAFEDLPRGPRAARRGSRSISPLLAQRYDRDVRPPADHDRQPPSGRRRSVSPSSQSSSSRRRRSPSRRPVSPTPLDREKLRFSATVKSPLESGEERIDSPATGKTTSSTSTSTSGSLNICGPAVASGLSSAPPRARNNDGQADTGAPWGPPADKTSLHAAKSPGVPGVGNVDTAAANAESVVKSVTASPAIREPVSRNDSPPASHPTTPAVPTGPRALRDGRAQAWQGPYPRGGGFARGRGRGAYTGGSSGMGTYTGRPSQREYSDGSGDQGYAKRDNPRGYGRRDGEEHKTDISQNDAGTAQTSANVGRSPLSPHKPEAGSSGWGEPSTSPWQEGARGSPRDAKQEPWATSSPVHPANDKDTHSNWGDASPSMKEENAGANSPGATTWPRRDSRGFVRGASDMNGSSPNSWVDQSVARPSDRRPFEPKDRWSSSIAADQEAAGDPSSRGGPSPRGYRPSNRFGSWRTDQQPTQVQVVAKQMEEEEDLKRRKPWVVHYREIESLRKKREQELDATLLSFSAAARKALRDLEVLEGELTAVNLNRKLRKEHLDKYKETFIGELGGFGTGDVAMI